MASGREPHQQAEHMAAPTNAAFVKITLATRSRPHMAQSGHLDCAEGCPLLGVKRTSLFDLNVRFRPKADINVRPEALLTQRLCHTTAAR